MNNVLKTIGIAIMSVAFVAGAEAKTLKFATLAPAGTTWMKEMKAGAEQVKQRTDGRVKLKFYPGGVMGNDQSVHRKIKIGQLHGGAFTQVGLAQVYPGIQVLGLPMLFRSQEEVDYVRQHVDVVLKQETEAAGFVLLGISAGGFARILSKEPMQDLESLRSSKIWVPEGDTISYEAMKAMSLAPVTLPLTDVLTGLQTGLLDIVGTSPIGALVLQWHTKVKYVTELLLVYTLGFMAIQKKAFDTLLIMPFC